MRICAVDRISVCQVQPTRRTIFVEPLLESFARIVDFILFQVIGWIHIIKTEELVRTYNNQCSPSE
jgi:hypothetical protein